MQDIVRVYAPRALTAQENRQVASTNTVIYLFRAGLTYSIYKHSKAIVFRVPVKS